ncbi:MAG: hypothetical protein B6I35_15615 [Anaerolineaceae bacterium 4572_32.2]|nr:MAG: hypothetical protein B6I35_15615 [Anaerolineaceae bacterium 4572_32.2]
MSYTKHKKQVLIWIMAGLAAATLVSGALGGCSGETAKATPTPTRTSVPAATLPPTDTPLPTLTPTPEFTPTPTPWPENVNPLTGEVVADVGLLDRVPVAIKISNWPGQYVRPQAGINSADLIFEHYNEGWFASRWTAIYLAKDPERVGPVRSGRLIDLHIPAIYKAVLACSGFSNGVLELVKDSDLYPDRVASPSVGVGEPVFYRDFSRDVPLEHTMYTSPALVRAWAAERGVSGRQNLEGMAFSEEPAGEGKPAAYILVPYRSLDAEWRYDESSGRYLRWSDGEPHADALTGEQLNVANVVVLYVPQWDTDIVEEPHSGALSIEFALWYSNRAIIFRDGVQIEAFWQHWEREDMLTLTDEDNNPIPLKVGNTFFEVIPVEGLEIAVE